MYIIRVFITVMNPIKPPLMQIKDVLKAYKEFNLVQIIPIQIDLLKQLKQLSQSVRLRNFLHKLYWKFIS